MFLKLSFSKYWHQLFQHLATETASYHADHDQPFSYSTTIPGCFHNFCHLERLRSPSRYDFLLPVWKASSMFWTSPQTKQEQYELCFWNKEQKICGYLTHLIPTQNYKENLKCSQHLVQENFFQTPDWQPKQHKILPNLVFAFYINPTTQTRVYSKFIMVNKRKKFIYSVLL